MSIIQEAVVPLYPQNIQDWMLSKLRYGEALQNGADPNAREKEVPCDIVTKQMRKNKGSHLFLLHRQRAVEASELRGLVLRGLSVLQEAAEVEALGLTGLALLAVSSSERVIAPFLVFPPPFWAKTGGQRIPGDF